MKYLTNSGLSYFFNKIKTYLTSSTYLNSIGISNSDIDDIADDAGYSSGSLPASEDIFITGDIIPNTDNSVDLGASSKNFKMIYTKGITINGTQFLPSDYIPKAGGAVLEGNTFNRVNDTSDLIIRGGSGYNKGAQIQLCGKDYTGYEGNIYLFTSNGTTSNQMVLKPDGTAKWGSKNLAMQEDFIPRSGGAVMTNYFLGKSTSTSSFMISGGTTNLNGASIEVFGSNSTNYFAGAACLNSVVSGGSSASIFFEGANLFRPSKNGTIALGNGNYRWGQIYSSNSAISTSDARLKNSIKDIDDALLDAWENIEPKQYKFNDATEKKGDKARFHTGYLAQDIQAECEKQGVNASDYGLFCYDEWEEQEEVSEEIETEKDGKIVKEKHVIQPKREKGDSYALRYEEALVVECKYLRRCIARLTARIEELEKGNSK